MQPILASNKRIAKNTLMLYFRMMFLMAVNLYTSRVILNALGVEDFGIYNVIGGAVAMFTIISGSLSSAISRFLTFELGKGNTSSPNNIFSTSVNIQLILSLLIAIIAETAGIYFLNTKMSIPTERIVAANWVLHFSVATFIINLISVPYNAAIIAHERMSAFAYIGIVEAIGKLSIALLVTISPIDELVFYSLFMFLLSLIVRGIYGWFCKRHFEECTYKFHTDKIVLRQMFGFAGWSFIGASANVLRDQGVNVLLNLFCGPVVNASRGIANQVNTAISSFVQNFMTALNPQITKSYACDEREHMFNLMFQGARFSFFLLLLLALPILAQTELILHLWLTKAPPYSISFVQLMLVLALIESISYPLITAMQATGNIKKYQIIAGGCNFLNFPLSYIALRQGLPPTSTFFISIAIALICLFIRLHLLKTMISLPVNGFLRKVCLNITFVCVCSMGFVFCIKTIFDLSSVIITTALCLVISSLIIFFIGCSSFERRAFINFAKKKFHG